MAITSEDKQKVKNIVNAGKRQGYLTHDEILDVFPEVEENLQLLEYIVSSLQDNDVEIIESIDDSSSFYVSESVSKLTLEEKIKILKQIKSHVSTDPIRAYLHEIGKIPLLSAEEEVYFAKKIEDGEMELLKLIKELGKKETRDIYVKASRHLEKGVKRNPSIEGAKKCIFSKDKKYLNKKIKEGIEAKHLLTTANLRLVVSIAKNYLKRG